MGVLGCVISHISLFFFISLPQIVIVPLTLGVLLELAFAVPFRISSFRETPILFYYTDWALGIVILKTWSKLCSLGFNFAGSDVWIQRFQAIRNDLRLHGLEYLDPFDAITSLVLPIMRHIFTCLMIPYVVCKGVLPLLGASHIVCAVVHRFA